MRVRWAWLAVIVGLALLGTGLTARLAPTSLLVPGTPSARAQAMLDREFGNSVPVTVLLQGPPAAIDRQGPRLVAALRRLPGVQVMAPWGRGAGSEVGVLRPRPRAALVVAGFQRPESKAMSEVVPTAERLVRARVAAPVHAYVGGVAAIATALQADALDATHQAELLAAPILVIVLLLVFRSPVAAAIPLLMGAATVAAGRGLLLLSTYLMPVNALAVAIASMMGLALGVDYALLMVSRFRQERDAGATVDAAIATAARAAGRTIVFAGGTVALLMVTAALVAPGELLGSVAAGVVVSTLLSVLLAISLLPAVLRALSGQLERWRLPSFGRGDRLLGLASAAIARPWIAIPLIVAPMLAVAVPASALGIGPPDPRQLPRTDPTRQGFEALQRVIGPGWAAPIAIVATARKGPISEPGRLERISRWQDRVARDPDVAAVIGPASLAAARGPLAQARRAYETAPARLAKARRGLSSLRSGLRKARAGVAGIRRGLGSAAGGAATIAARTREAQAGSARLGSGLGSAAGGARRLHAGLGRASRGSRRLVRGQRRLRRGAARVARGLRRLDESLRGTLGPLHEISVQLGLWSAWLRSLEVPTEMAGQRLETALGELEAMTVGRTDPRYAQLLEAVREAAALIGLPASAAPKLPALPTGVPRSVAAAIASFEGRLASSLDSLAALPRRLERVVEAIHRLRRGSARVAAGARASERGGRSLRNALERLDRGGRQLDAGLASAHRGNARLTAALGQIAGGGERLSAGLRSGRGKTGALSAGLARPQGPLGRYQVVLRGYGRDYRQLRARSPGAVDSGYLMLTALDGTVPGMREQVDQVVNLEGGGQAVRMLVVPKSGPSSPRTVSLTHRLRGELPALGRTSGTRVAIGEGAQSLTDYSEATMARIPWLVLALCLVSVLTLIVALRSLALPVIAIALNLLTIAAAFGALQLFFGIGILVGPRYIDAISAAGVLTIMFVLSVDYEVFLLTRMREAWLRTGDHAFAIEHGLARTAGVITGAAAIMSSVFLAFATADIASLQQFGAGLTFAVLIDATVVRLILLPAVMRALGPRAWWLPGWLDRLVPEVDHGEEAVAVESPPGSAAGGEASPTGRLAAVAHDEHERLLELLGEIETASEGRQTDRVIALVGQTRDLAEPHFRHEREELFPHLTAIFGDDHIAAVRAAQDRVLGALVRIEELSGPARVHESAAAETRRLLGSARDSVASCDALAEAAGRQAA